MNDFVCSRGIALLHILLAKKKRMKSVIELVKVKLE